MTLIAVFNAGRVRRWHTNPELAHTNDFLDGHQGRVARIILKLHPHASRALLVAALTHDDGEWAIGDISGPAKAALRDLEPIAWDRLQAVEDDSRAEVWGCVHTVSIDDAAWLRFADRLDAYTWAKHHGARMDRNGWPEAWADLQRMAEDLGCIEEIRKAAE